MPRFRAKVKREDLYTAIIICIFDLKQRPVALKYHNVDWKKPATKERFLTFARGFDGAKHINLYTGLTKKFVEQVKL